MWRKLNLPHGSEKLKKNSGAKTGLLTWKEEVVFQVISNLVIQWCLLLTGLTLMVNFL